MRFFKTSQTSVSGVRLPGLVTSSDGARTGDDGPPLSDQRAAVEPAPVPIPPIPRVVINMGAMGLGFRPLVETYVHIDKVRAVVELVQRERIACSCCDSDTSYKVIRAAVESLLDGVEP